jgi:hypothetical protein
MAAGWGRFATKLHHHLPQLSPQGKKTLLRKQKKGSHIPATLSKKVNQ